MCAVCRLLEDEKHQSASLQQLVKLLKQQTQDTRSLMCADLMHIESVLSHEQRQQIAGD